MLHVIQQEFSPSSVDDLRDARGEELEHHSAKCGSAALDQAVLHRVFPHSSVPSQLLLFAAFRHLCRRL
jgi:hypothetical protein